MGAVAAAWQVLDGKAPKTRFFTGITYYSVLLFTTSARLVLKWRTKKFCRN